MITASTRLLCVLGHPVGHSLSPRIHNAALAGAGIDAVYLAFDVAPERFADAVTGLRAAGFLGANVTIPHKQAALAVVDELTEEARAVGAANTLFWSGDRLVADNTDAAGLEVVLRKDVGLAAGDEVVVFGTGGAARAAAVALGRVGAAVRVDGRRPGACDEILAIALAHGATAGSGDHPRVVVNATPLGLGGESLPQRYLELRPGQVALDLLYGHDTPFLAAARANGAKASDGLGMLIGQAAASFERWTGMAPDEMLMRAAVR